MIHHMQALSTAITRHKKQGCQQHSSDMSGKPNKYFNIFRYTQWNAQGNDHHVNTDALVPVIVPPQNNPSLNVTISTISKACESAIICSCGLLLRIFCIIIQQDHGTAQITSYGVYVEDHEVTWEEHHSKEFCSSGYHTFYCLLPPQKPRAVQ